MIDDLNRYSTKMLRIDNQNTGLMRNFTITSIQRVDQFEDSMQQDVISDQKELSEEIANNSENKQPEIEEKREQNVAIIEEIAEIHEQTLEIKNENMLPS